jgi:hypothetical protein
VIFFCLIKHFSESKHFGEERTMNHWPSQWRLPAARWLTEFRAAWLGGDVVAEVTPAAYGGRHGGWPCRTLRPDCQICCRHRCCALRDRLRINRHGAGKSTANNDRIHAQNGMRKTFDASNASR